MDLQRFLGLTALGAVLALAGCAQPIRRGSVQSDSATLEESTRGAVDSTDPAAPKTKPRKPPRREQPAAGTEELPVTPAEPAREDAGQVRPAGSLTGVPVCDRYLASFKQCHTSVGQSSPAQIDERYQRLRETLVNKSGTPEGRAQISRLCKDFSAHIQEALGDRKCGDPPR